MRKVALVEYPDEEPEHVSFCRSCLSFGHQSILKSRVYPKDKPLPADYDQWLQCHSCGEVFPIHEKKNEAMITDFVETVESPFDLDRNAILAIDCRNSSDGKQNIARKKKQKELDEIQDKDIISEIEKGNNVTIHQLDN